MEKGMKIEAEGGELILKNKAGDYVIIPKKYRLEVKDMIKENCHKCIDALVETLPVMEDYAGDGTLLPSYTTPEYMKGAPQTVDEGYTNIDAYYKRDSVENRPHVKAIQKMLINRNHLPAMQKGNVSSIDGLFGDATKAAYESYIKEKARTNK